MKNSFYHLKSIVILAVLALLTACSAGIHPIQKSYQYQPGQKAEAIAILKANPSDPDFKTHLLQFRILGLDEKGLYQRFLSGDDSKLSNITSQDAYFIFKVDLMSKGTANAITYIGDKAVSGEGSRALYGTDCGGESFNFQITAPGIYYLGDLTYSQETSTIGEVKFAYELTSNLPELTRYLTAHYPSLTATEIKEKPLQSHWNRASCSPGVIYI